MKEQSYRWTHRAHSVSRDGQGVYSLFKVQHTMDNAQSKCSKHVQNNTKLVASKQQATCPVSSTKHAQSNYTYKSIFCNCEDEFHQFVPKGWFFLFLNLIFRVENKLGEDIYHIRAQIQIKEAKLDKMEPLGD